MQAIILAAGSGTRLKKISGGLPKCLVKIGDKPVIVHQILELKKYGFIEVIVITCLKNGGEMIEKFCGNGNDRGMRISYFHQETDNGLGAGAIKQIESRIDGDFLLVYGDTIFNINLQKLVDRHKSLSPIATLVVHPNNHPYDSDLLETDHEDKITRWLSKKNREKGFYQNLVNAGIYVLSPKILNYLKLEFIDLGTDTFPLCLSKGEFLLAYNTSEYVKDMGTEDRYYEVLAHLQTGLVEKRNLLKPQAAGFLDRDGVINKENGFIVKSEDFILEDGAAEAIRKINESGLLAICVTNAPAIAKNLLDDKTLKQIHNKMETLIGEKGGYLDAIFYCPHHPKGGKKEYAISCDCRKPGIGMLLEAGNQFNIDFKKSYMIGDFDWDIEAGKKAGMRTLLILRKPPIEVKITPDKTFNNLLEAVTYILES